MATHSSTLAWKIPWTEGPGRLQSMGSLGVGHDWGTSLSLFTFMHWRRKCQPTPVFLPGESQGQGTWWAAVYGAAQSRTRLKRLSTSSSILYRPGFSNTWTVNFQMFKLVLEKAEEPEIKLPTSAGSSKKQESSRKTSISALLTMPKPLTVCITINCGKFWERWEYQTTWPASWETCMRVRKQQLEQDMEQQTGSK